MWLRDAITQTPTGRIALLTSLYFSQGLPFGFFTQALPVFLREADVSLKAIGFSTLLALPWVFKFLWAPFVDRGPPGIFAGLGYRRGFILPLQVLSTLALVVVAFVGDARALPVVLGAVLLTNFFAATQDIATDGLAVDILKPAERGIGNGIQVAAYRAGMIIGGGALLVVFGLVGWRNSFLLMAAILLVATVPSLLMRGHAAPGVNANFTKMGNDDVVSGAATGALHSSTAVSATQLPSSRGSAVADAFRMFRELLQRKGMWAWALILVAAKFGDNLATGMLRPALVDVGYSLSEIGWMLGTIGFAASLIGALLGGGLVRALGNNRALLLFTTLQVLSIGGYFALFDGDASDRVWMTVAIAADHFFGGMATAALFTRMMDACGRRHSATDYTVQASIVVLATGLGSAVSGFIAFEFGFATYFAIGVAASILCVVAMALLLRYAAPVFDRFQDESENDDESVTHDSTRAPTSNSPARKEDV